jgi:SAM-dependent MidA family methyltransferase
MAQWIDAGRPQPCQLVELGPGRGTLMRDILKVFKQFPETKDAFSIHLVEVSSAMRLIQADTLQSSGCTFLPHAWYDSIKDVPKKAITYHIAHEFFDALPVHQFQVKHTPPAHNYATVVSLFSLQIMDGEKFLWTLTNQQCMFIMHSQQFTLDMLHSLVIYSGTKVSGLF